MQYSFLGFSVTKMMELNLDMKDIAILRYFIDFKDTGRMHFEIVKGNKYYWVNYRTMEEEMPYLCLGKKTIMTRMLRLRDLGILVHYTKKEGGTFSFFALGSKYIELINENTNKDENKLDKVKNKNKNTNKGKSKLDKVKNNIPKIKENITENTMEEIIEENEEKILKEKEHGVYEKVEGIGLLYKNREDVFGDSEGIIENSNSELCYSQGNLEKAERVFLDMKKGYSSKGRTKTLLLNNSSTKETNIKKYIKKDIDEIIDYLNSKIDVSYSSNSKSTIKSISERLREGFALNDFKTVIDKKVKEWLGTDFEQYLRPSTLFGDRFENYLNQKNINNGIKNNYESPKLRFNNFKGRDYDYDLLEKQLLGWA